MAVYFSIKNRILVTEYADQMFFMRKSDIKIGMD